MAKSKNPKKTNGNGGVQPVEATATTLPAVEVAAESAKPRKSARKPTIFKSEARVNLVPINIEDEIRQLAYLLSERRGFEPGHETEDWLMAEREVRERYQQHSA